MSKAEELTQYRSNRPMSGDNLPSPIIIRRGTDVYLVSWTMVLRKPWDDSLTPTLLIAKNGKRVSYFKTYMDLTEED